MKWVRLVAAAAALGALPGCDTVHSSGPMGEEVVSIAKSDWEGFWLVDGALLTIQVIDEDAGELMVSSIELRKGEDGAVIPPKVESDVFHLRSSGGWLFASYENRDDPGVWDWARVEKEGDRMIAWAPAGSAFRTLVSEGVLPGTVEEGEYGATVILGELDPSHYELITSGARGVLFDWDEPLVLVRIDASAPSGGPPPPPPPRPPGSTQGPS